MYKEDRTQSYDPRRTSHMPNVLHVTSFSINNNKSHKSRLKYKIKYDLYILHKKSKSLKSQHLDFWSFQKVF